MLDETVQNQIDYKLSVMALKYLLEKGLITVEQYEKIDKLNVKSFNVNIMCG